MKQGAVAKVKDILKAAAMLAIAVGSPATDKIIKCEWETREGLGPGPLASSTSLGSRGLRTARPFTS